MILEEWANEVKIYLESLNVELQNNEQAKNSYYGFYVWDSQVVMNPDILFIGINPGRGDGITDYSVEVEEGYRISYLDFLDEEYNYPLAKETFNLLEPIFSSQQEIKKFLENKVAKTNLYYIKTDSESDIKRTISYLGVNKWKEFYGKSCYFTVELIKILKPKVVLFEGKSAYENIIEVCYNIKGTWKDGYGHITSEQDGIEYIGYSRLYSNIQNKKLVSNILAKYISGNLR